MLARCRLSCTNLAGQTVCHRDFPEDALVADVLVDIARASGHVIIRRRRQVGNNTLWNSVVEQHVAKVLFSKRS